jgi:hypothetical protein
VAYSGLSRYAFFILKSLEGGVSSPNPNTTDGRKHNSAKVPYLESYYPKYSRDPRCDRDEQILVEQDKGLPRDPGGSTGGCEESVQETGKKPVYTTNSGSRQKPTKPRIEKRF